MQNQTLIAAAKAILKDLLAKCTEEEQNMFKRMYSKDQSLSIEETVEKMDPKRMDWAITQCEQTLLKKQS